MAGIEIAMSAQQTSAETPTRSHYFSDEDTIPGLLAQCAERDPDHDRVIETQRARRVVDRVLTAAGYGDYCVPPYMRRRGLDYAKAHTGRAPIVVLAALSRSREEDGGPLCGIAASTSAATASSAWENSS